MPADLKPAAPIDRVGPWVTVLLLLTGACLIAGGSPSLSYAAAVFCYIGLALVQAVLWLRMLPTLVRSDLRADPLIAGPTLLLILASLGTGIAYLALGGTLPYRPLVLAYVGTTLGAALATLVWYVRRGVFTRRPHAYRVLLAAVAVALALPVLSALSPAEGGAAWPADARFVITNPPMPPARMADEAMGGADGPFFPSSAATLHGDKIPADYLLSSDTCGEAGCHVDVYAQWNASMHHFSSFNNQFYRKSIEYMQEIAGLQRPQWCAGCHDPAVLFTGKMARPVAEFVDTPEGQAGLGCVACHSITGVQHTMGNGGFVIEYPAMHDLLDSDNAFVRAAHDFVVRMNPKPHRNAFLKSFHREQPAEFCSSCHKVHLDEPVNSYRWVRGFNSYDNWQASGVSGQGARSFYEPPTPMDCLTCHMPLVPSDDPASKDGFIRSHRFAAANTAVATANIDSVQVAAVRDFLQADQVAVDIFAVSEPEEPRTVVTEAADTGQPQLSSTFAVAEEQGMAVGTGSLTREATQVFAPLADGDAVLRRGTSARLDVVLRTLRVGHTFPAGTVDAQEVWLEVKAVDDRSRTIFWSGWVEDDGRGPVDPSAHFYRSLMVDANGNPINKRNAFMSRSVVYVNLVPPGAADVAHYRLDVPEDAGDTVTITARVHYRKFNWWHTQFAYRGVRDPADADPNVSRHFDDGRWVFEGDVSTVSGKRKAVPEIPIVTMAENVVTLAVTDAEPSHTPTADRSAATRTRWNDYGIGLFREGDLKGAEQAFRQVMAVDPAYADGLVNLARVYLQEGNLDAAERVLDEAERIRPGFHKTRYFRGLLYKAYGRYPEAMAELKAVSEQFPRDRVVLNDIGRVYFLNAEPERAIPYFERVLAIDPEDLTAHYNMMLCYRAAGDLERSAEHEARYLRFKADESATALARSYRLAHPHDNNEASPIHEHRSFVEAEAAMPASPPDAAHFAAGLP